MEAKKYTPATDESNIVEQVARIFSSVRGARPDYARLAAELETTIPFDIFGVVLLRYDREGMRVTICQREGNDWSATYRQHPLQDSLTEQLVTAPAALIRNYPGGLDGTPAECGDALCGFHHVRSSFIAPLITEGENMLGTLELGSVHLHSYENPALKRLIGAVVRVLADAIEGAQVGGSAAIQNRQREALKSVSTALTSQTDLHTILEEIATGIAESLNAASAIITVEPRTGAAHLEAQSGFDETALRAIVERADNLDAEDITRASLNARRVCISDDIAVDNRYPPSRLFAAELGMRSIASQPLISGSRVYGALLLCSPDAGGFTPLKTDILSLFASQATIAIHNRMLLEAAHQRSRFQKAIEQLQHSPEQPIDDYGLFTRLAEETSHTFGVSLGSVLHFISEYLLTRGEQDLHALLHHSRQEPAEEITIDEELRAVLADFAAQHLPPGEETAAIPQDSAIVYLTRVAEDARARTEMLGELSRLLTHIKQTPEQANDAIWVIDTQGLCFYMNAGAEMFCEKQRTVALGASLTEIFAHLTPRIRNAGEVQHFLRTSLHDWFSSQEIRCVLAVAPVHVQREQNRQATSLDDIIARLGRHGSGSPAAQRPDTHLTDRYYQFSHYPLLNVQGVPVAFVLQAHDITEQVRDEKNKSVLLSTVSHELRTPLTSIKAAVTGLLQADTEWDRQEQRELLEVVDAQTDQLTTLVNALVDMSRIEMGALSLEKTWCDVVEILDGALLRHEKVAAQHQICTCVQPDMPLIFVDYRQMEHVFANMINNAIRRSPPGAEIQINLSIADDQPAQAQFLRVQVIDRGHPIPDDERERIFKSFSGRNGHGMGLSLAICRGIIEAHQGKITVEDGSNGSGACFTCFIPFPMRIGESVTGDGPALLERGNPGSPESSPFAFTVKEGL